MFDPGICQRVIQPPFDAASAAVKPREAAVGVAQGAQGGRDARDGVEVFIAKRLTAFCQRRLCPSQQGKDLQQVFGVTGGYAALGVDLIAAFAFQRGARGGDVFGHALERQTGVDQTAERLEPRQAGRRALPPLGEEFRLMT